MLELKSKKFLFNYCVFKKHAKANCFTNYYQMQKTFKMFSFLYQKQRKHFFYFIRKSLTSLNKQFCFGDWKNCFKKVSRIFIFIETFHIFSNAIEL